MGEMTFPPTMSTDDKRNALISHLVIDHEASRDDLGGALNSFDALALLHETWEQATEEGDPIYAATDDGTEVVMSITEDEDIIDYRLTPDEAFRLGSALVKSAGIAFAQNKINSALFGG
jgi:hypothetical protein